MIPTSGRTFVFAMAIFISAVVCTGYITWQHTEEWSNPVHAAEPGNLPYSSNQTNPTVAYINGAAIDEREFHLFLAQVKALVSGYFQQKYDANDSPSFWTTSFQGEVPFEKAKQLALERMKRVKVQQLLAQQYGLLEDPDYSSFLDKWAKENQRRKEAVNNHRVIYGPQQYDEWGYYTYVYSTMVNQLKAALSDREEPLSEQELIDQYEELKGKLYQGFGQLKALKIVIPYSTLPGIPNETAKLEAKAKIDQIKLRLEKGEDIQELRQSLKRDETSHWIIEELVINEDQLRRRDIHNPDELMMNEALSLPAGQISGVLEMTPNSFGLIQTVERKEGDYRPYREVKDSVRQRMIDDRYESKVKQLLEAAKVVIMEQGYQQIQMR
ncbi:hypothetical protein SAMN03159341_10941 [Paenibacillus sp. 1_12]|uniref:peptidylprolyl isomerase n=1 Tax=Paenibacillus sp. 1_12 TaxID=1566278 RepID=UPI0008E7036A|nr:peptidyl-prolyl cis-trans isomerase [Paenibacillus sp. 1_12]SFL73075.1 hypothetical protein SAMN03159341_10941 [Paenibacillus sp. 1_12]